MKSFRALFLLLFCCLNFNLIFAQNSAPEGIYYQAVARDDQGSELILTNLSLQISIKENAEVIYTENHSVTSDLFGLFELVIGNGQAQTVESFEEITWEASQYFLMVSLDLGTGYELLSETQLLSVPYSLYSSTALNVINDNVIDADADPSNELVESFQIVEDSLKLTEANTTYSVALSDIFEDGDWDLAADSVVHNSEQTNKVGINTTSPSSTLHVNGTLAVGVLNTGAFEYDQFIQLNREQSVVLCDVTTGPIQVTLPDASECTGRIYHIKKYSEDLNDELGQTVTINTLNNQTIDNQQFRILDVDKFQELTIISDGSNWFIISRSNAQ